MMQNANKKFKTDKQTKIKTNYIKTVIFGTNEPYQTIKKIKQQIRTCSKKV